MVDGFSLDKPVYTPREVGYIYTAHVKKVSYPTILDWIQIYNNTNGKEGIKADKSPRGRYLIAAEEVERVLLQAGAKKKG